MSDMTETCVNVNVSFSSLVSKEVYTFIFYDRVKKLISFILPGKMVGSLRNEEKQCP